MKEAKKLIYRAGFIPYCITSEGIIKMMFMVPSLPEFGGDRPQIAKGKVDDGETNLTAALREATEELGLFQGSVKFTEKLGTFFGRTELFIGKVDEDAYFGEPSFETGETMWLTPEQFDERGRDLHKPAVKAAVRLIQKLER